MTDHEARLRRIEQKQAEIERRQLAIQAALRRLLAFAQFLRQGSAAS